MDMLDARQIASASADAPHYIPQAQECELFEQAWRSRLPLLIKGPTGCGKTRFVEHMAARLGRPLITVSCHDDLSAADLVGRHLIGQGATVWQDGPLARAVREGAICYLDEVVEARKDTTVVIHPLADDRRVLPIERTGELLIAPPEFMLVVSFNPGYQNLLKALKPSTRQRFVALSFVYPTPQVEQDIVRSESGVSPEVAACLVRLGQALRRVTEHDLEETASTRLLVMAARLIAAGTGIESACRAAVVNALTDDADTAAALMEMVRGVFDCP
ncbi:MAG: CbbQ/NirQ/NorQ/GpvN family protein [Aquabacterium sp.]